MQQHRLVPGEGGQVEAELQIGERNLQVNTYEYEVERPDIDFTAVLSRADVREALKAPWAEPDNAELQRKADRSLAQGPLLRKEPELHVEQSAMSSERQSSPLETFSFVRECQGVQIGNDATRKNRFVYVVAPTVDARQLFWQRQPPRLYHTGRREERATVDVWPVIQRPDRPQVAR